MTTCEERALGYTSKLIGGEMSITKILLDESEIPTHWYNVIADLRYNVIADLPNSPAPYLGPDGKPVTPEMMGTLFPPGLLEQPSRVGNVFLLPTISKRRGR